MNNDTTSRAIPQTTLYGAFRRLDIDALRALGIVVVVLFHAHFLPSGFLGVDILFVLSGFLMAGIIDEALIHERFSLIGFYARRALRVVPALALIVGLAAIVASVVMLPTDIKDVGRSVVAAGTFQANIFFRTMAEDYFTSENLVYQPLLHCWSLAVEGQFYILVPLIVIGARIISRKAIAPVLGVLALASFAYSVLKLTPDPQASFYLLPSRFWELATGALVHFLPAARQPSWRKVVAALGALLLGLALAFYYPQIGFPGVNALLPVWGTALIIYARPGEEGCWPIVSRFFATTPVQFTAHISYSLYLWHWPLFVFARYRFGPDLPVWLALLLMVLSIILSYLSWRFVEQPFLRLKVPQHPWRYALVPASMLVVLIGLGFVTRNITPKYAGRFLPEKVRMLARAERDALSLDCALPQDADNSACRFGGTIPEPDTFLWGNSFARMWLPAIDIAAKKAGHSGIVATRNRCTPTEPSPVANEVAGCAAFNHGARSFALKNDAVKTVVLFVKWFEPEAVARGTEPIIRELTAKGKRVFVVLAPPQPGYLVPRALAMASLHQSEQPPRLSGDAFRAQRNAYLKAFQPLVTQYGVRIIDPTDFFCDKDICHLQGQDGTVFYHDYGHITKTAALQNVSLFERVFSKP